MTLLSVTIITALFIVIEGLIVVRKFPTIPAPIRRFLAKVKEVIWPSNYREWLVLAYFLFLGITIPLAVQARVTSIIIVVGTLGFPIGKIIQDLYQPGNRT